MIEALIVDDEPLVQVGIQSMIDWQALGIRLLPSSPNGLAALDLIKEKHPDIVLTDVRMPLLDGIGLIKRCKSEMAVPPEFIVMSSYEEFAYVREAMKQQAVDYLVKLEINAQVLSETLERAKKNLEQRRTLAASPAGTPADKGMSTGAAANAEGLIETSAEALIDRAFQRLLHREFADRAAFAAELRELGSAFEGKLFAAVQCRTVFPQGGNLNDEDRLRTYLCAVATAREILGREYAVHSLCVDRERFTVFVGLAETSRAPASDEARLQNAVSSACTMVFRYFNISLRCGIGSLAEDPLALPLSQAEALAAMERSDESHPVSCHRPKPAESAAQPAPKAENPLRERLEQTLLLRDENLCAQLREEALARIEQPGTSFGAAIDLCASLCHAVISAHPEGEALLDSFFAHNDEGYKSLYTRTGNAGLIRWLHTMFDGIAAHIADNHSNHRDHVAQAMRRYVDTHFREKLKLDDIAERFSLSPNYAGALFKKHTGLGLPEYLARLKVEKARNLIDQGQHRVYEVSDLVGFESSFYFSKVFKKIVGISPTEYRDRVE